MKSEKHLRLQSLGEEISNSVSHGLGALLGIIGTVIMVVKGVEMNSVAAVVLGVFYGGSLTVLYTVSCLYHSLKQNRAKKVFRILDHCSIFLLISGTYAPISVVLNAVDMIRWEKLSLLLYVIMGWMCLFTIKPLIESTPQDILWLLISGGVAYTAGIIFYKMDSKKYMHFIWHIFVLAGSVLHFFFVYKGCYQIL